MNREEAAMKKRTAESIMTVSDLIYDFSPSSMRCGSFPYLPQIVRIRPT